VTAQVAVRKRRSPERAIQAEGVRLLRSLGAKVWTLGTTRRKGDYAGTMQTAGAPDVIAFMRSASMWPHLERHLLIWEAKAPKGRLRPEQADFQDCCHRAAISHVVGGLDELIRWLTEYGYLRRDQVAHYRVTEDR
jgi:hypothetical protein